MKTFTLTLKALVILSTLLFTSCVQQEKEKYFISDTDYRQVVEQEFLKVKQLAQQRNSQLFDVFDKNISLEEAGALKFLYAFMPLNDLANNDGDFYLRNLRLAFATRDSFTWGNNIPEEVFRHFVLPYRINNEDSDTSRGVLFRELYPRIKDMNIEEAALEVNHWCHEKANYQPTNIRTMAPLGVIKTAYGRCGEESTFTVSSLRSVGIPARQVYTPRWAHADDNHAWVEVFINGEWKYLGACEPLPKLNMAWFDAPVLRAMMVHTKAFGQYNGSESVLGAYDKYSILNLLSNYVSVKEITIQVTNTEGTPIQDTYIEFGLYNYAEYYPLKTSRTNNNGLSSITTSYGDLRVFTSDSLGNFEVQKVAVKNTDTLSVVLNKKVGQSYSVSIDNIPPIAKEPIVSDTSENQKNTIRLLYEDSIRNNYINTFYTDQKSNELAKKLNLDNERVSIIMSKARGNYAAIESFLLDVKDDKRVMALQLLETIAEKDLHDVTEAVLMDHVLSYISPTENYSEDFNLSYVLNPRILNEQLTAYRTFLQKEFKDLKSQSPKDLSTNLISWIKQNVTINNDLNYYKIALSPTGVYELKVSDEKSRNSFFVAVLRSLGIPARIEQATLTPQYYDQEWISVSFNDAINAFIPSKAYVTFEKPKNQIIEPLYRIHFGLAKYDEQKFVTLEYDWEKELSSFDKKLEVEPGYYQLTTGNRQPDGSVLVNQEYFKINEGEQLSLDIAIRKSSEPLEVLAKWNSQSIEGNYSIYGWIDPDTEPGNHFLNDIDPVKSLFEEHSIPLNVYCEDNLQKDQLRSLLPSNFKFNIDKENTLLKAFYSETKLSSEIDLPVFVLVNKEGEVLFHCSGYNIGTPEQLLKIVERIK